MVLKDTKEGQGGEHYGKKQGRRILYGLVGAVMAATAIGSVAAKESKPYDAPELRLAKGMEDYNLLEGITYNENKYELEIADEGQFDIDTLGKYEVEYALIPVDPEETAQKTTGTAGGAGSGAGTGSAAGAGSVEESTVAEESSGVEESTGETDAAESTESTETTETTTETGTTETSGAADESQTETKTSESESADHEISKEEGSEAETSEAETSETKESDSGHGTKESEAGENSAKENESADQGSPDHGSTDAAGDTKSETEVKSNADHEVKTEAKAEIKSDNVFSSLFKRLTGYVYAAENEKEDAGLDESDKVIYFTRDVRVVMSLDAANIQFDEPVLQIESNADLYEVRVKGDLPVATPDRAEKKNGTEETATPSQIVESDTAEATVAEKENLATDAQLEWDQNGIEDQKDEADSDSAELEFDGMTENGTEYTLNLKNPDLILGDTVLTDKNGKTIKKAKVTIKDDTDLKTAVEVTEDENGRPVIGGLRAGRYEVELTSIDPSTKEELNCIREIEIVEKGEITFDAPVLYIGTRNETYDLTQDVIATDESGEEVTPVYVVNEEELLKARISAGETATSANAKKQEEDVETSDEADADNTNLDAKAKENLFKPGTYHVTLGVKHPESGEEFTTKREIRIVDGYYIYAPTLEIEAGTKDYDLLSGVEVRNGRSGEVRTDIEVKVSDISSLKAAEIEENNGTEGDAEERYEEEIETEDIANNSEITGSTMEEKNVTAVRRAMKNSTASVATETEDLQGTTDVQPYNNVAPVSMEDLPAVKAGVYTITLVAEDPESGETITTQRNVRVVFPFQKPTMQVEFTAYGKKMGTDAPRIRRLYAEMSPNINVNTPSLYTSPWYNNTSQNGSASEGNSQWKTYYETFFKNDAAYTDGSDTDFVQLSMTGKEGGTLGNGPIDYRTYHYNIGGDSLIGLLGYGGEWYEVRGMEAVRTMSGGNNQMKFRAFATGRIHKDKYEAAFGASMGNTPNSKLDTEKSTLDKIKIGGYSIDGLDGNSYSIDRIGVNISGNPLRPHILTENGIGLKPDPYTGYYLTQSIFDKFGNDSSYFRKDKDGKITEGNNEFKLGRAYWKNVGYNEKRDDTKKTMRDGGAPDVTLLAIDEAGVGQITQDHLNWLQLAANKTDVSQGVDRNSSISIDGNGKVLYNGTSVQKPYGVYGVAANTAENIEGADGIQIELKNFKGIQPDYVVGTGGYLRLTANLANSAIQSSNIGVLNDANNRDQADATVELVGPDADANGNDQKMQLFQIWNINDVIVRAGKGKMTPVRVVVNGQAAANQRIEANGQTIEFYQLQNSAGWNGMTTINGKAKDGDKIGRISFKNTEAPAYTAPEQKGNDQAAGDAATADKIEKGNLLRLKNLTLESDIELEKSDYVGWSQHQEAGYDVNDRANYSPLLIDGTFVPNGHKIKLVKEQGEPYKDGEIVAGFANATDMNSTATLDPADFELMNPKQGEEYDGKYYFLVSANDGKTIKVKALTTLPIEVNPGIGTANNESSYFKNYEDALNKIVAEGTGTAYTITNHLDVSFTENANLILKDVPKERASALVFKSGKNAEEAGRMYRISIQPKTLTLPAETKVTFTDITLRSDYQFDIDNGEIRRKNPLVFINNGGNLEFGEDCNFISRYPVELVANADKQWEPMYVVVYAGTANGNLNADSDITIRSGTYDAVYGGNLAGYYSGKAVIRVEQKAADKLYQNGAYGQYLDIRTINGADAVEIEEKPKAKQTEISITGPVYNNTGETGGTIAIQCLLVQNLYNYDLLNLEGMVGIGSIYQVIKIQPDATQTTTYEGKGNLNAQKIKGYLGKTVMADQTYLQVNNPSGEKVIGSLRRSETINIGVKPVLALARPTDCQNINNPYLFTITEKDPLYAAKRLTGEIRVSYTSSKDEEFNFNEKAQAGDIVIKLPNVEKPVYNTTKNLFASFKDNLQLVPNYDQKTIVLGQLDKKIIVAYEKTGFNVILAEESSVATALDKLFTTLMPKYPDVKDYKIFFAANNYTITDADIQMMADTKLRELNSLEWSSKLQYDGQGKLQASSNPNTVNVNSDLNFYTKNTEITYLNLRYNNSHNIFANGTNFTVGLAVKMIAADANLPVLYGGADGTITDISEREATVEQTKLTVKSGTYKEIYGGGKGYKAKINGNTEIILDTAAYFVDHTNNKNPEITNLDLRLASIHGSGSGGSTLANGMTRTIKVVNSMDPKDLENVPYELNVKDMAEFDRLDVGEADKLAFLPQLNVKGKLESAHTPYEYTGDICLYNGRLNFEGSASSHANNLKAYGTNTRVVIKKDKATFPLLLDGKLTLDPEADNQMDVGINGTPANQDIMLQFKKEADAIEDQYRSKIDGYTIGEDGENIILEGNAVLVQLYQIGKDEKGNDVEQYSYPQYPSVAKALNGIGKWIEKHPEYATRDDVFISIYGDSYQFTDKDTAAMEWAAKTHKPDESMPSSIANLTALGKLADLAKLTWRSNYGVKQVNNKDTLVDNLKPQAALVGYDRDIGSIRKWWLPAKSTYMTGMSFLFKNQFYIYADGKPTFIDAGMTINAPKGKYPNVYAGSENVTTSTDLTIKSGHYGNIYGGGYGTDYEGGKVTGDTKVKLAGEVIIDGTLSGNGKIDGTVTGTKTITIAGDSIRVIAGNQNYVKRINEPNITVADLVEFDQLSMGKDTLLEADTKVTVTNSLRGSLNRNEGRDNYRGDVFMTNTILTFKNKAYGWFNNLNSSGPYNVILLSKQSVSYPLKIREKTTVSQASGGLEVVKIGIDGNEEDRGDVAVIYDSKANANPDQYGANTNGFMIIVQDNKLIIDKENLYFVDTKNDQHGLISTLMVPASYNATLNGSGSYYSGLYDYKTRTWKSRAPLVAYNLRNTYPGYYYKDHFDPVETKFNITADTGESYPVYRYQTAKNNLPAYAGMKDTFTFGSIKGLTSGQISSVWNRDTQGLYYYDSTNDETSDPYWENLGEGNDFYDWETGEWKDDPDVKVRRIKRTAFENFNTFFPEFTWKIGDKRTGIIGSEKSNSSVEFDMDSKGNGNRADSSQILYVSRADWAKYPDSVGQVSIKHMRVGNDWRENIQYAQNTANQKCLTIHTDNRVIRLDSWYGVKQGWYWDSGNTGIRAYDNIGIYSTDVGSSRTIELPNSVLQIRLSDTDQYPPAYMSTAYIGTVMIKAGKAEPLIDMDITHFLKRAEIDTGDGNILKMISLNATGFQSFPVNEKTYTDSVIQLKGTGTLAMTDTHNGFLNGCWYGNGQNGAWYRAYPWWEGYMGKGYLGAFKIEFENAGFTLANANQSDHFRTNEVLSNGYQLNCVKSLMGANYIVGAIDGKITDLTQGFVFAQTATTSGKLDPTDFYLVKNKTESEGLFFTRRISNNYHQIIVTRIKDPDTGAEVKKPIKVTPAVNEETYFDSYRAAFEAIQTNGTMVEYTVQNLIEWEFTEEDAQALVKIDAGHATALNIEGGRRNNQYVDSMNRFDTTDTTAIAREYYRVRLRKQALMMPDDVPVTFNNIILKYDQGSNHELNGEDGKIASDDIIFINNGCGLKFGDKVQFLKHQDEDAYATVIGGSVEDPAAYGWKGFSDTDGTTTQETTIQIASGIFSQVYGAGTKTQGSNGILGIIGSSRVHSNIVITGGTVGQLYGGGKGTNGKMYGDTSIAISGKTELTTQTVYGGGDGADVAGSTYVEITADASYTKDGRTIYPGISQKETSPTSVFGGGYNGVVEGNSAVVIHVQNDVANHSYYFDTVSAFGTVDEDITSDGAGIEEATRQEVRLSENSVKGTVQKVVIEQDDPKKEVYIHLNTLSGFSELCLGNSDRPVGTANDFNAYHVTVKKRFDGNASKQSNLLTTKRTDTVRLYAVALTLDGEWQGHIGNLAVTDVCAIKITKTNDNIYPMILDGQVTQNDVNNQIRLRNTTGKNAVNDKVLTFTDTKYALPTQYTDGHDTGLSVDALAEADVKHIIFRLPQTHIAESYVTYAIPANADRIVLDEETPPATTPDKVLHYVYDKANNPHEIKGGYVVEIPKGILTDGTAEDILNQYMVMDTGFINQADRDNLGPLPTMPKGGTAYEIRFDQDGINGKTDPITIQEDAYWYLAHFTCKEGDVFTMLTDVSAPVQAMKGVETETSLSTNQNKDQAYYQYTLTYRDFSETNSNVLPYVIISSNGNQVKHRLPYNADGVTKVYWSLGTEGADKINADADAEAAKRIEENIQIDLKGKALRGEGTVKSLDGKDKVTGGDVAVATIRVPQELVEAHEEDGVIWVYLKDSHNNTVKVAILLNKNIINVRVPLKVYVVAVKKENTTDPTPELLAPDCYVVNDGINKVQAEISGFESVPSSNAQKLKLSDKTVQEEYDGVSDEISLFIRRVKKDSLGTTLPETLTQRNNVLSIKPTDKNTWLNIGELGPKTENTRTKDFTFDAIYNPQLIVELGNDQWVENRLSYHFTINP